MSPADGRIVRSGLVQDAKLEQIKGDDHFLKPLPTLYIVYLQTLSSLTITWLHPFLFIVVVVVVVVVVIAVVLNIVLIVEALRCGDDELLAKAKAKASWLTAIVKW